MRPPLARYNPFSRCVQYTAQRRFSRFSSSTAQLQLKQQIKPDSESTSALQEWIDEITSRPPSTHYDYLDPLRASQLLRSLPTRQHLDRITLGEGDELPQCGHMVYFQPETMLKHLGNDGSSPEYNAPPPYTRRMWAGGSISWPPRSLRSSPTPSSRPGTTATTGTASLKLGQRVMEKRSIEKVEVKKGMIFIHQRRVISDPQTSEVGLSELRTHVFRTSSPPPSSSVPPSPDSSTLPSESSPPGSRARAPKSDTTGRRSAPDISFTYTPTSPLLFRYSALTFNAHKIHYDHPHSISPEGEGQRGILVHGPLSATLLIELAGREGWIREFRYRAVGPMVVDQEVRLVGWWTPKGEVEGGRELEMMAIQADKVCMKATAVMDT